MRRHNTLLLALLVFTATACGGDKSSSSERDAVDSDTGTTDIVDEDADAPDSLDDSGPTDDAADVTVDPDGAGDDTDEAGRTDVGDTGGDDGDAADEADTAGDTIDDADDGETRPSDCPVPRRTDYSCSFSDPASCPEGLCLFGLCLGPVVNADRWDSCGDGVCDRCELASDCPVDCGEAPTLRGEREYDNETTVTISVHGFNVQQGSEFESEVYGHARRPGGAGSNILRFAPDIPDGNAGPAGPNQMIGVEYYGGVAADWFSAADIAEIEANDWRTERALHRYALIVGKFINHYAAEIGATHVNLLCHSMGCHVTRYMIENDIEGVASSGMIARWYTMTGVLGGARLARLFDNPLVRSGADLLNMNTSDFVHMNPDYVTDNSAWWDHNPHEANNPLFRGVLIHHIVGTNPFVSETADLVPLLDLNNPADEPNDGIVYSWDEFFHDQAEDVRHETPSGDRVLPTATYQNLDHFDTRDSMGTAILGAAALYHQRKVWITVRSIHLLNDLERDSLLDLLTTGDPPAEVSYRVAVRYNPYVQTPSS